LHALGVIPTIASLAVHDPNQTVRKKAILALSSSVRNYQPNLDVAMKNLREEHEAIGVDAADMDAVDVVIQQLRDASQQRR
jgi:hsp70-interacting protein